MRIDFVADTNFIIYLQEGKGFIKPFLDYNFGISFITEVELLGYPNITELEIKKIENLIADCFNIEWNTQIKEQTIRLKRAYKIKLPDAIIAASSMVYGIPLVTADKGFNILNDLELILIED